ncbi:MAG: OmpA family protein [Oscillospiraceae bacterium]|nr:OmpA family protein [Oscillospiraceae bacterium]
MAGKRSNPPEEPSGGNEWLPTYADMVTLLFAFFVLLFALSQIDVQRFNLLVVALSNRGATADQIIEIGQELNLFNEDDIDFNDPLIPLPIGPDAITSSMQTIADEISDYLDASGVAESVQIVVGDDYLFLRFLDDLLFAGNSAAILPQNLELLNFVGWSLRSIQDEIGMIRIDGHTATIIGMEGTYHVSDRILSTDRANAILRYFEDVVGIEGEKLSALGFGRFRPLPDSDNLTEEGRRRNRRIEIMITSVDGVALQLDNIYERLVEVP